MWAPPCISEGPWGGPRLSLPWSWTTPACILRLVLNQPSEQHTVPGVPTDSMVTFQTAVVGPHRGPHKAPRSHRQGVTLLPVCSSRLQDMVVLDASREGPAADRVVSGPHCGLLCLRSRHCTATKVEAVLNATRLTQARSTAPHAGQAGRSCPTALRKGPHTHCRTLGKDLQVTCQRWLTRAGQERKGGLYCRSGHRQNQRQPKGWAGLSDSASWAGDEGTVPRRSLLSFKIHIRGGEQGQRGD